MLRIVVAGVMLGVLSRVEEVTGGLDAGISENATWLAAAAVAGALVLLALGTTGIGAFGGR